MKAMIITDGRYHCMENVSIPVEVSGWVDEKDAGLFNVSSLELVRIGANPREENDIPLCFIIGDECEVIE
ncbi:MAG: hypothetical protein ACRCXB_31610 [Aeromonadaceae bacterium]